MLEWLKRHAWKVCKRQKRFAGSNPALSANRLPSYSDVVVGEALWIAIVVVRSWSCSDFLLIYRSCLGLILALGQPNNFQDFLLSRSLPSAGEG